MRRLRNRIPPEIWELWTEKSFIESFAGDLSFVIFTAAEQDRLCHCKVRCMGILQHLVN